MHEKGLMFLLFFYVSKVLLWLDLDIGMGGPRKSVTATETEDIPSDRERQGQTTRQTNNAVRMSVVYAFHSAVFSLYVCLTGVESTLIVAGSRDNTHILCCNNTKREGKALTNYIIHGIGKTFLLFIQALFLNSRQYNFWAAAFYVKSHHLSSKTFCLI